MKMTVEERYGFCHTCINDHFESREEPCFDCTHNPLRELKCYYVRKSLSNVDGGIYG